eukprot:93258-Chlamydomonas_euryale.AAC.1
MHAREYSGALSSLACVRSVYDHLPPSATRRPARAGTHIVPGVDGGLYAFHGIDENAAKLEVWTHASHPCCIATGGTRTCGRKPRSSTWFPWRSMRV